MTSVRRFATLVAAAALVVTTAACGGDASADDARITLTVDDFGNFGYRGLLREYEAAHPGVRVVERVSDFTQHHEDLARRLDAGSGAGDVVAVEEGYAVQFRERGGDFVNLLDLGAGKLAGNWLPWKWDAMLSADGRRQIGLGTDIGGLAMCYRPDLLKAAGMPSDRGSVAKLWPTWSAYIDAGRRFRAAGLSAQWTDSAGNVFNQILAQQPVGYFDRQENLALETGPGVRTAWDLAVRMVAAGESAKYVPYSAQWRAALQGGRFATMTCPAWALGWIQQNAPATRGQWDVTVVPGAGGNWGGSWLTVPRQSAHPREAYELAAWLTAPEQQRRIFLETGNLPSAPALYDDPGVTGFHSPFFSQAPVGRIFTDAASRKPTQYIGLHNAAVRGLVERKLSQVEIGQLTPEQAWREAVAEARKVR
ncbi:ABC transporter substrate-binding protein [Actinoplanes sp. NBRC 14428]|uniref:Cellobiose-binding protein n=1 Tax=Pseudosporangium ferrugineum TaxID=439699 RepID=A0A2T0S2C3_9ACTN|nr:ABC transporter substrate-binding protein [Pseudosporangium ferrugineum]PRY27577.1 cellobiose-binding protein [Pseudosporangium ferrugineum]BCJ55655.1 ABC transporter substrate-binding protein [Actinoplanes sp. NBRC 14428]